jgi:hypothetical protein
VTILYNCRLCRVATCETHLFWREPSAQASGHFQIVAVCGACCHVAMAGYHDTYRDPRVVAAGEEEDLP